MPCTLTMATLFDSLVLVGLPSPVSSSIVARPTFAKLPQCIGLRLRPTVARFMAASAPKVASHSVRVVREAQDTVIDGQFSSSFCEILWATNPDLGVVYVFEEEVEVALRRERESGIAEALARGGRRVRKF